MVNSLSSCRRLLASENPPDVINVDLWIMMEIDTATSFAPEMIWSAVSYPHTGLYDTTSQYNVPMSLTFKNATIYDVRIETRPICCVSVVLEESACITTQMIAQSIAASKNTSAQWKVN